MNSIPLGILFLILFLCLFSSAFFSASETAMMALNRYKLKHQAAEGNLAAKRASQLLNRPEKLIGTILLGNNFVNILATSLGTVIGIRLLGDLGVLVATVLLTVVILVFSEVAPKTLAVFRAQQIAFPASLALVWLVKLLSPLVKLLNAVVAWTLRPLGIRTDGQHLEALTNEELKTIVASAEQSPERREMLMGVLELEDISVGEAMIPRNELEGIDLNDGWQEILTRINDSKHGRLVAYRDNLDQVEGMLHLRDIITAMHSQTLTRETIIQALRPCSYVPDSTALRAQLLNFRQTKSRSALVVDEYGDLKGLITLEDILTHIVGDLETEEPTYVEQQKALYTVAGSSNLRQLNRELGLKFPLDSVNTLSGLIIEQLGSFPEPGTVVEFPDCRIKVLDFSEGVVQLVELQKKEPPAEEG